MWETLDADEPIETGDGEVTVVPKKRYCQQCEHFSDPPDVECHNPGTEIREVVDNDHFRVVNCPIVVQRRSRAEALEREQ